MCCRGSSARVRVSSVSSQVVLEANTSLLKRSGNCLNELQDNFEAEMEALEGVSAPAERYKTVACCVHVGVRLSIASYEMHDVHFVERPNNYCRLFPVLPIP